MRTRNKLEKFLEEKGEYQSPILPQKERILYEKITDYYDYDDYIIYKLHLARRGRNHG
jgi:hypothetical protein